MRIVVACALAGCAASADLGLVQQPELSPKGVSGTGHIGIGGGGTPHSDALLAIELDTRVDVASGGSRWTAGASALGGVRLGPVFAMGRAGIWRAIASGTREATVVPSLELGAYVPLDYRYDPKHPAHGEGNSGLVVGLREDFDDARYFTVFAGYAVFLMPGY